MTSTLRSSSNPDAEPPNSGQIAAVIQQARAVLDSGDNWDGEGRVGYSDASLQRANEFLQASSRGLWQRHHRVMPIPEIEPGPDGSIDFHWQVGEREMLLNMPADPGEMLDFYGDTTAGESVKGRAYAATVGPWLLAWLTE